MQPPDVALADAALIGLYGVVLMLPGALLAWAGGLRGWSRIASAPLLTYAVAGLAGPWSTALGIAWSPLVLAGATLLLAGMLLGLRGLVRSRGTPVAWETGRQVAHETWSRRADLGGALAVAVATVFGIASVLGGLRRLGTIPQDWDAVFHANGIRWIAETGDASLFGMSRVNWYEPDTQIFYPNAYHLVGAVVRDITGRDIPSVLNAHTVLLPGLAALVLTALVRRSGGPVVTAAGAALAAAAVSFLYDMLWRGPLLPYSAAAVLTPVFVLLLMDLLDARGARRRLEAGSLLALATAGLLCLHPATLFGAAVLGLGFVLVRWARRPAALRRDLPVVVAAGVAGLGLSLMQIVGSLHSAASFPAVDWPAVVSWPRATFELVSFGHAAATLQVWPAVLAAVGLVFYRRLGELRWVGIPLVVFGVLFVLSASSDAEWVNAVTRPWWNDRYRLAGLFGILVCILVGHGLAQAQRAACALSAVVVERAEVRRPDLARLLPAVTAALVLFSFVVVSNWLYLDRNVAKMALNTGEGPAVSTGEVVAMQALGHLVPPDRRVLNDRNDGSVWMYAIAGVRPVAGHYDATGLGGTDVELLTTRFNRYADDPEVRAAVERLDVGYVMVGEGFLRGDTARAPGLTDLDGRPYLEVVFRNTDAAVYRIVDPAPNGR